jgi:hypothetical protein
LLYPAESAACQVIIVAGVRAIFVLLIAAAALVLAIIVLGYVGPYVAGLGLLLAAIVLLNPGGAGSRLRQSIAWWSIPGMRRASSRGAPFAALLLLYTVPVPISAFALVQTAHHGAAPSSQSTSPQAGVGGGSTSATASPSAVATPPPTTAVTVPPTSTSTATPTGTPAPTLTAGTATPTTPPRSLCGAPPNPWNYNFCGGGTISAPPATFCDYFSPCIASFWSSAKGYVEECRDGSYSHSGGRQGSCSSHGGDLRPVNP